jgi:hypothetical protein
LLKIIASDVPYIPLFLHSNCIALSSKFIFPGYNQYSINAAGPYLLPIKPSP